MSEFLSEFVYKEIKDDKLWELVEPLIYQSDRFGRVEVPATIQTDFSSVPRVPIAFWLYGGKCHREAVLHDMAYRIDSDIIFGKVLNFDEANDLFLEAMVSREKPWWVRKPMYRAVCWGGKFSYHKRKVFDRL